MNDEIVKVSNDDGHRERWAISRFFYFKEGKKLTLKAKTVLGIVSGIFGISSLFVLIQDPEITVDEKRQPIGVSETVADQSHNLTIERGSSDAEIARQKERKTSRVLPPLGGPAVSSRPRISSIPPGTFVKAKLITGASNGLVKAILLEPVSINGEELIENGSVLVGMGSSGEDRLDVQFQKLVFKDGFTQDTSAKAADSSDQVVGLKGSKISKYGTMVAASVGLHFAAGVSQGLQEKEVKDGVAVEKNTMKNAALQGTQNAALETSKEILEKWKNSKTVIEVPKGTEIFVLFAGD